MAGRPVLEKYLRLNKNILVAFVAALTVSAVVAQLLADQEDYLNTTYATIADYLTYFAVFSAMYYMDNRATYRTGDGGTDTKRLRHDLKKLITSLGVGEVVYTAARWSLQYYLLTEGHDPYSASIISQGISTIIYMAVVNLSVKVTRLYKDGS